MYCAMTQRMWIPVAIVAAMSIGASRADAQDPSANPTYGSVSLRSGFLPDPFTRNVTAGGSILTNLGGVRAHVAAAPDFRLHYQAGNLPLIIRASSGSDTTLLVNLPNGQWIANDDGGKGLNPSITIPQPMSGRYDIFVGTYSKKLSPARLVISERGAVAPNPGGNVNNGQPNPNLNPTYGSVNLRANFLPDPFVRQLTAGGPIATQLGGVSSHVTQAPDFRLNYQAGGMRLTIRVESATDTTLLVNLPNGTWIANDDAGGNRNPSITFNAPPSGRFDIWVGTFGNNSAPARLIITERQ